MKLNVLGVRTPMLEKQQGACIQEGMNTKNHSAIKRNDWPCGNIVERNTIVRYSNFKQM